ncbi:MAG: DUF4349 domain-containing protein [Alphaproteobacteria bacterium HGW-Alphaproteobacteria-18]|nr:MAG: DUF4349 domain-containing protein [Alphaproteobacteria bacterium HGW-Alphaproteobacteria-18]
MLRKFAAAALPLLFIAACGAERGAMPPMSAPAPEMAMLQSGGGVDAKIRGETGSADPTVQQYIAYSHTVGMRLPLKAIEPTQQAHVAACKAAGPAVCVVTNSWMSSYDTDYMNGSLGLRATPTWIETFLSGVEDEAKAAKGEISNRQTTAEDLTVSIIDTGARVQALETLRGRLQQLLADRPGELGEILETERELARVNGELDSLKSILTTLRQRVDMSQLTVSYETKRDAVTQGGNAIGRAFSDFFANLASATAAVITGFAFGLPWMLLLGALLWIWLRLLWPRIRRKKPAA